MSYSSVMQVHFEPTMLGESLRDTLVVVSKDAGEFQCPLLGSCVPPKPQGPVDVSKVGGSFMIWFFCLLCSYLG